jgi:membrane associated rhomboid family serine protease
MGIPVSDQRIRASIPPVTAAICALCIALWVGITGSNALTDAALEKWGYVTAERIWGGASWGLITSPFAHIELVHMALNVYWMWLLGGAFERTLGPLRLAAFVIASAWVSSGAELLLGDSGIGLSGVNYALFGFIWMAKSLHPEFRQVATERVATTLLVWFVLCFFLNSTGALAIANMAHAGGLLFGGLLGVAASRPVHRPFAVTGLVALTALATAPVFGCPWTGSWNAARGMKAMEAGDYKAAVQYIKKGLAKGEDAKWAWHNLAEIYGFENKEKEYADALRRLRTLDLQAAQRVEERYGKPDS